MIPILYDRAETRFITNGVGRLSDVIKCTVTEERNGVYELEFVYPITGVRYDDIQEGCVVMCTHDDTGDMQPFDIYGRSAPIDGLVTFYAHHISYRLADVVTAPFTASGIGAALDGLKRNSINVNEFQFWTDKSTAGTFTVERPDYIRGLLGGQEGSILDVFGGGEYEFDRYNVRLYQNRGTDSGVEIRYGKNLIDITHEIDTSGSYNAVVPFWMDPDTGEAVMLPEKAVIYSGATILTTNLTDDLLQIIRTDTNAPIEVNYQIVDARPLDLSDQFEEQPTEAQMRAAAEAYLTSGKGWMPAENITVDFVALWQTDEYAYIAPLQRVRLCDTVNVYYPQLGVSAVKIKVIKTVYNVLLDRYDEIELGEPSATLAEALAPSFESMLDNVPTVPGMEAAINHIADLIRGGLGGYVVMKPNADGTPEEILIMDTPDITTAVNVIRMNRNGIGFSQNGYAGPFNSAWTIDGTFYADYIKAGTLSDLAGLNYWNMITGRLVTKAITATDYIYMDGDTNAYFRIPYSLGRGSLELSRNGLIITAGVSRIRNSTLSYSGGTETDNKPYGVTLGLLTADYSDDDYTWHAYFAPTELSVTQVSGNQKQSEVTIQGGYLHINRRSNSRGLMFDTFANQYYMDVDEFTVDGAFSVTGTKNRKVKTDTYGSRLLYSYETPAPYFGDIGEGTIDEDGLAYIDIDDIFTETIGAVEYQVFLQKEGAGDCWIEEKTPRYFVVSGTPGLRFAWELKALQRDYELMRLESGEKSVLDEYEDVIDDLLFNDYVTEQEEALL